MLQPGDIVIPSKDSSGSLILWRSNGLNDSGSGNESEDFVCEVPMNSILLLIKVVNMPNEAQVSNRWKNGCYVLAENGAMGWVGSGWIEKR